MDAITTLNVLSSDECGAARSTILDLRGSWLRRNPYFPFFTLGAASYIDATADRQEYYSKAREFNPLLSRNFGWLYDKLVRALQAHFGAPVIFAPSQALPGYHIYLAHPIFEKPIGSIHCDTQYRLLDWTGVERADYDHPMSFTLSIALPQCGGGLNLWELHHDDIAGLNMQELARRVGNSERRYFSYEAGQLVLHSGHTLHQAAPATQVRESDERITLQGHALCCDGVWKLYW